MREPGTGLSVGRIDAAGGTADSAIQGALGLRQRAFAEAILDPAHPVPAGLVGPGGEPSARRFAVYRNNVVAGLIEALKHAYPAVLRIVGDAFFSAMARVYVAQELPVSPIMHEYGAGFADFLDGFEPVASLPYLPDVARLERAWIEAYHAAEAAPLAPASLQALASHHLPDIGLVLHPSVRTVCSPFPAVRIWQTNIDGAIPVAIDIDAGGEDALVARPEAEVDVRVLPCGAATFIQALAMDVSTMDAAKAALRDEPRFDLAGTLACLMAAGAFIGWKRPEAVLDDLTGRFA